MDTLWYLLLTCLWLLLIGHYTLSSLQIFFDESHPNMHNQQRKEGLSLFGKMIWVTERQWSKTRLKIGIVNHTRTPLGHQLLKHWFFRPSLELPVIQRRHDTVEFLSRAEHNYLCDQLLGALKNIKNIPRLFAMMKKKPKVTDWQALMKFAYYSLKIRTHLSEYESGLTDYLASVSSAPLSRETHSSNERSMGPWIQLRYENLELA